MGSLGTLGINRRKKSGFQVTYFCPWDYESNWIGCLFFPDELQLVIAAKLLEKELHCYEHLICLGLRVCRKH